MTETSPDVIPIDLPGLVCAACGRNVWRVERTRLGTGVVRRWRKCAGCGHAIRTAERVEADAHPDRDAA